MKAPLFLTAIFFMLLPVPAEADEIWSHAEVVCQKGLDAALVRFTFTYNDDAPVYRRLPTRIDRGLSAARPVRRQNCTMGNGWKIRIRSADKQAFAYGIGYADPPAFFSLWIAGRKVVSRMEWKPGYDMSNPWIVGLVIRPDRLTYCRVAGDNAPHKGPMACRDVPLRLARYKPDRVEYAAPGERPAVGTMLILPGSPQPAICHAYLRARRGHLPDVSSWIDSAQVFGETADSRNPRLGIGLIEVAPGVRRKLINWASVDHYFDGDLMFLAPPMADPWAVLKSSMLDDATQFPVKQLPAGWSLISGGQPGLYPDVSWRYVHFDSQRIGGRLYLLAQPTNQENRPTAILVQPMARGFRSVCRFQRVEPNF